MDTQHSTHGSKYAYSSPDYPAFYDAWVDAMFTPSDDSANLVKSEDTPVFAEVVKLQIDSAKQHGRNAVHIVDLGTGTRRCVRELWKVLDEAQVERNESPGVVIWGVDHAKAMLERAEEVFEFFIKDINTSTANTTGERTGDWNKPKWVCASATGFADAIRSYPGPNEAEIDAILMSVGTIHHLIEPKEVLGFLKEMKRGLRAGSGVGIVSVLDEMYAAGAESKGEAAVHSVEDHVKVEFGADLLVRGRDGRVYSKSPTVTTWDERAVAVEDVRVDWRVKTDRWTVECYEGLNEGWDEGGKKKHPREVLS